ncbi:NADH:flavin oxidoreductase [Clostridium butyricum]|uniref:NADH:flavin oxidoreductase n=1 Tax=Clostridium butyricum TaxID=1492 RepID=UPI003466E093
MKQIFEQIKIGKLNIDNRIVRSATMEFGTTENGNITDKYIKLYEELAKGGSGLIITGAMAVNCDSQVKKDMINIYNENFINSFSKVTNAVHSFKSKIVPQLAHGGLISIESYSGKRFGPSNIIGGKEMSKGDINRVIMDFSKAAEKCKQAGADGIEIHAAHGFLISQFLSPAFNKRQDEYGGSIKYRSRILFEIINSIKSKVGYDFPILIKLNYSDLTENRLSLEDSKWVCSTLDNINIDAIEISSGIISDKTYSPAQLVPNKYAEAYNEKAASIISDYINTPIICVGGNRTFSSMEQSLNSTNIKAFSICRPLICEPDLPEKWRKDNSYIPKCISCNSCFKSYLLKCSLSNL